MYNPFFTGDIKKNASPVFSGGLRERGITMSLTTKDILEKTFKRSFKGYDEDEVDKFLDEIIDEFKALKAENDALKKDIKAVKELESNIKNTEETIMNTLVSAQKSSERLLREAARKAELLIDNAENTAKQKTEQTTKDLADMERKLATIKQSANNFAVSFSEMMSAQAVTFEKTYQSYFGDMDAYSSSGINIEALEKLNSSIAGDIGKLMGSAEKQNEILDESEPLEIDEQEENINQLEINWEDKNTELEEPQAELKSEELQAEAEAEPEELQDQEAVELQIEDALEAEAELEEPEAKDGSDDMQAEPEPEEQEKEEPADEIVKDEPAVPLEPIEETDEQDEKLNSMPLNEINKALTDMDMEESDTADDSVKAKYDDYSWLYGDDDSSKDEESGLSIKDKKKSEELKNLIDDVID